MNPVSPLPIVAALCLAYVCGLFLVRRFGAPPEQGRFASIDGLRGYLAFFVFLHHSSTWYFYLQTGNWDTPPSNLHTHLGQTGVAFFFMITGFLFFAKILDGRARGVDWGRIYVSRILRLVPLYLLLMALLFVVIAVLSGGELRVSVPALLGQMARWMGFTIMGTPDINGVARTNTIVAGVTWSLVYEWFFYFSLPLVALLTRKIPPASYIALGVAGMAWIAWSGKTVPFSLYFVGGMAAAVLVRHEGFRRFAAMKACAVVPVACVAAVVEFFPSAYGRIPLLLLSIAFAFIASGNSVLGLLTTRVSRTIGEMAYSIYLLHGITLFSFFHFVVGVDQAKALTPGEYWLAILGLTPVLILGCFVTFRFVEQPAMQHTSAVLAWLRALQLRNVRAILPRWLRAWDDRRVAGSVSR